MQRLNLKLVRSIEGGQDWYQRGAQLLESLHNDDEFRDAFADACDQAAGWHDNDLSGVLTQIREEDVLGDLESRLITDENDPDQLKTFVVTVQNLAVAFHAVAEMHEEEYDDEFPFTQPLEEASFGRDFFHVDVLQELFNEGKLQVA